MTAHTTAATLAREVAFSGGRTTRARILDAAEDAFAREGYFAATIRGITQAAGTELSLSRYYFGSKDELFRQVVARRADAICTMLEASLAQAGEAGPPDLRGVVEAMVVPATEKLAGVDPGWRNYLQLLAGFGPLAQRHDLLAPWRERYAPTAAAYRGALAAAMPGAPRKRRRLGFAFPAKPAGARPARRRRDTPRRRRCGRAGGVA
jgi:AcrR family transcriptional regulator